MFSLKKTTALALLGFTLTACADQYGPKQTVGTLAGGAAGAVAATNIGKGKGNIAAIAIGTLLGAAVGGEIGKSLDRADRMYMYQSSQQTFELAPTGATSQWNNPDSGNYGTFTPTRTFTDNSGTYCREYTQTVAVGGRIQEGYGVACRMPDGTWQIRS